MHMNAYEMERPNHSEGRFHRTHTHTHLSLDVANDARNFSLEFNKNRFEHLTAFACVSEFDSSRWSAYPTKLLQLQQCLAVSSFSHFSPCHSFDFSSSSFGAGPEKMSDMAQQQMRISFECRKKHFNFCWHIESRTTSTNFTFGWTCGMCDAQQTESIRVWAGKKVFFFFHFLRLLSFLSIRRFRIVLERHDLYSAKLFMANGKKLSHKIINENIFSFYKLLLHAIRTRASFESNIAYSIDETNFRLWNRRTNTTYHSAYARRERERRSENLNVLLCSMTTATSAIVVTTLSTVILWLWTSCFTREKDRGAGRREESKI